MRIRALVLGAAALLALAVGGCGEDAEPARPPGGGGNVAGGSGDGVKLDNVDACALLSDEELQTFFGEPAGGKEPRDGVFMKACALDNASEKSYVFISVMVTPTGDKEQFDYNKSVAKNAVAVSGVGDEAFGWYDEDEAQIEARHRGAVVGVGLTLHVGFGTLDDPKATLDKVTVLAKQALARL